MSVSIALATKELIDMHGLPVVIKYQGSSSYDPSTGSVTNTTTTVSTKAYPKDLKATQYNYPNLVGKQAVEFLVAYANLTQVPVPNDKVTYAGSDYTVSIVKSIVSDGSVAMLRLISVKG